MSRLLLLRHAKSSWGDPALRRHRPAAGGARPAGAAAMAKAISERGLVPDRILCSPARRTRETLAALLPYLGDEGRIAITESLYQPPGGDYRSVIAAHGAQCRRADGDRPQPGHPGDRAAPRRRRRAGLAAEISGKYPTGALAVIEFDTDDWSAISPTADGFGLHQAARPRGCRQRRRRRRRLESGLPAAAPQRLHRGLTPVPGSERVLQLTTITDETRLALATLAERTIGIADPGDPPRGDRPRPRRQDRVHLRPGPQSHPRRPAAAVQGLFRRSGTRLAPRTAARRRRPPLRLRKPRRGAGRRPDLARFDPPDQRAAADHPVRSRPHS